MLVFFSATQAKKCWICSKYKASVLTHFMLLFTKGWVAKVHARLHTCDVLLHVLGCVPKSGRAQSTIFEATFYFINKWQVILRLYLHDLQELGMFSWARYLAFRTLFFSGAKSSCAVQTCCCCAVIRGKVCALLSLLCTRLQPFKEL